MSDITEDEIARAAERRIVYLEIWAQSAERLGKRELARQLREERDALMLGDALAAAIRKG